jgi:hypothetical protein
MIEEKLVSLVPPAVPIWAITSEGSIPVVTLALVQRETKSSTDGSRYEVRPLLFVKDLGVTDWDEHFGDVLGYSVTPLNTDEIKEQFAREIARMERREACREAGIRKIKTEITERRLREGLSLKRGEKI